MMHIEKQILAPEQITITKQKEVRKNIKFVGRIKVYKGQKLYKLDLKTRMIYVVEPEATYNLKGEVKRKHTIEEDCIYTVAINLKNAERKFLKMFK